MKEFTGVFRYEYRMSIRRWSLWLAFGVMTGLHLTSILTPPALASSVPGQNEIWPFVGTTALMLNLFMPVAGGILAADRLVRDRLVGVQELMHSTPLPHRSYLLGKYLAAVLSIATPVVACCLLLAMSAIVRGAPAVTLPAMLAAFLGINLPTYIFITAFSLVCPLVMPLRVYQVLFTGYWFWGNFISPQVMPTVNGTYLTANGTYALLTVFGGFYGGGGPNYLDPLTTGDALINLAVLGAAALLALLAGERYLAWQQARA